MFKRSRRKIVAAIMSILVLLWVATLGLIYVSSYYEMTKQNKEMLQENSRMYTLPPSVNVFVHDKPMRGGSYGSKPGFDSDSPMFKLSVFYNVALSYDGEVLDIKNNSPAVHSDEELEIMARDIIKAEKNAGFENDLSFYREDKGGYTLVTFMDNTVVNKNAMTLFRNTLIFGGVALVLFFCLSVFLARRIVRPLEESYQKQKQFISDAGHELKTPVSVVSANVELLSRELGDNTWLSNIQYENERMGKLVGQLLELARTENVRSPKEPLDLSRLVAGGVLPFESVAFEKGLELKAQIADGVTVVGNKDRLGQLVSILVDNAICHSSIGKEVFITLSQTRNTAVFSVINSGEPIPQAMMGQLFERFYRADEARGGGSNHYGLGLAIAKAIAQDHSGKIEVRCYDGLVEFKVTITKSQ